MENKICSKCKTAKKIDDFSFDKRASDGRASHCRKCNIKYSMEWASKNKDKVRKAKSSYIKRNYSKVREYDLRVRTEKRAAYLAHSKVNNGLAAGKIKKLPCEVCGAAKVQAHHPDYSKPLDIIWLCPKHHSEVHQSKTN